MKMTATIAGAIAMFLAPAAFAGDPDTNDDEWECTCTATCDAGQQSVTVTVCADDDAAAEATSDGANSCARALGGQCTTLGRCACTCNPTGNDC
jgi:hypothetical protein